MRIVLTFLLMIFGLVLAQDYSGTFVQQDDPSTTISFQAQDGGYLGLLISAGKDELPLEATPQEDYIIGLLSGEKMGLGNLFFVAQLLEDGNLGLSIAPLDAMGNPIESEAQIYAFVRQDPQTGISVPSPETPLANQANLPPQGVTLIAAGQAFPAGTTLFSPWTGVSFQIPENHTGYFNDDYEAFVLIAQDNSSILLVEAASTAQAVDLGYYAIDALAEVLSPESPEFNFIEGPYQIADIITASFLIAGDVYSAAVKQGATGNAAVVLAYGPQAKQLVQTVTESIQFTTPNSDVNTWKQQLSGLHMSAGSSSSSHNEGDFGDSVSQAGSASFLYDFCSNGQYQHEFNNVSYVSVSDDAENMGGTGMMLGSIKTGSQGSYIGTWDMVSLLMGNPLLVLESNEGELFLHSIWETGSGAAIDSRAYQVSPSQLCE